MTKRETNELLRTWENGNRKDVAAAALKLNTEEFVRFVFAMANRLNASEPITLARIMETMK